ncbi:MAG: ribonuclease R [Deltaproteobacteria bacterium]|nr:ribonuclease R [Deltaproteobacteria bacterium]
MFKELILQKGNLFAHSDLQTGHQHKKKKPLENPRLRHFKKPSVREANIVEGRFIATSKGFGFVNIGKGKSDVFIPQGDQNGALDGDLVEVRAFTKPGNDRSRGYIQKILQRSTSKVLAKLVRGQRTTLAIPINQRNGVPPLVILKGDDQSTIESGTLVEVELLSQHEDDNELYAKVLQPVRKEILENLGFNLILTENRIRSEFPVDALEEAEAFSNRVVYSASTARVDQRDLGFVTIDGKTARDFDDAVFAKSNGDGSWQVYVTIADVAHYVRPGSAIDQEAYLRGTSVYFPTHSIPMLPENLSNNLCSLKSDVNRFTLTCEMLIDSTGWVQSYRIYESVIRSRARLIYEDVAEFLDTGQTRTIRNKEILDNLIVMDEIAKALQEKRTKRGAINFNFAEQQIELDDQNQIAGISKKFQSSSMKLIEQFMLEANETVAKHCTGNQLPALYRVHGSPDLSKLERLKKVFQRFNIPVSPSSLTDSSQFNKVLESIENLTNKNQLQILLLRSMALATYETDNQGHFGLGAKYYSHFTSPIRRYPDLVTHRSLKHELHAKLGVKPSPNSIPSILMADYLSEQERRAEKAELESNNLMKVNFMEKFIGQTMEGQIVSTENNGFRVELLPYQIDWFLPVEALKDDNYFFDEINLVLQGHRTKKLIEAGDKVELRLTRADTLHRLMEFDILGFASKPPYSQD